MWIFTKYGFYSAVCARQGDGRHGQPVDPNRIMVRCRVRQHLETLKEWMQHIEQRGEYDCGLTSTAMAGGLTYEQAEELDPRKKPGRGHKGLWAKEMIAILEEATGKDWRTGFAGRKNCRISEYRPPKGVDRGIMLTNWNPEEDESHWVLPQALWLEGGTSADQAVPPSFFLMLPGNRPSTPCPC